MNRAPVNPFWRFSLCVYRAPGVQEACLALQERCGADVNLLLFCGWSGRQGRGLDSRSLRLAMDRVGSWQSQVIAPLRLARRGLKGQLAGPAGAVALPFRKRVAALELDLERAEQAMLAELAAQWAPAPRPATRAREAIEASLGCYMGLLEKRATRNDLKHLACIAEACSF